MSRTGYIKEYYERNCVGVGKELSIVEKILIKNVTGKVLDCGCGPCPQIYAILMPNAKEIYAIDLPKESIIFVKKKLKTKKIWWKKFKEYKILVENIVGKLPKKYVLNQINKIKSVSQADVTKKLPFKKNGFDTILSLFSFGTLKNEFQLEKAIKNVQKSLKKGGKFIHFNTNGQNTDKRFPEYTWKGLKQPQIKIRKLLKKYNFNNILFKVYPSEDIASPYKHNKFYSIIATKG